MAKRLLAAWAILASGLMVGRAAIATDLSVSSPPAAAVQAAQSDGSAPATQPVQPGTGQSGQAALQPPAPPQSGQTPPAQTPPARLIKKRGEAHATERTHPHPLDERCKPLKDELEAALQKPGNAHRLFQARLAHNAGNRLCSEGHPDRGIAELQRGLSYLQENPHP